ncbi:MAG TPA: hypothetical protein VFA41_07500 [Ktedonobacteraceae bacterium]|nr:hypothetical protein [Ktedonobacteraceae bacterium]
MITYTVISTMFSPPPSPRAAQAPPPIRAATPAPTVIPVGHIGSKTYTSDGKR